MKDMIVRLDINYDQHYEPSGSRNGRVLGVSLSYRGDLAVREVDPQAAPVAYRVTGLIGSLAQCSERVARYEIRVFDGRLWWPLVVGDDTEYDEFIMAARNIRRRLASCGTQDVSLLCANRKAWHR
jgi:hypothetical protein